MSVYDPLGLISHITIHGRILFRSIVVAIKDWDEEIPKEPCDGWQKYLQLLEKANNFEVPRCIKPPRASNIELHTFVDASIDAFAACVYVRSLEDSNATIRLLTARSRVAPIRNISIPRLELQAALLGARLTHTVERELRMKVQRVVYWSDSQTVLAWITGSKRYNPFVNNRVSEILETTTMDQWRWVPTKENPADAATKISNNESLWNGGPSFLTKDEVDWPKKRTDLITEEEIVNCHFEQDKIIDIDRYSDWMRLVRHLIILRKFTEYLRNKAAFNYIVKISDVEAVKNYLFKRAQREGFPDEMECLEENEAVKPKSSIRTLTPYLDENGVLRCNSRLKNVECLPSSARMPIILPQKNRITKLIVRDCHENCLHQADNVVVSMLRQEYWIINMRAVLNNVKRCCQWCILYSCKPAAPLMANIPEFRVQPHTPPFRHTGVDYFGPFEVAVRRSTEKRWEVIFVCMSTRAVHLEVAPKLDTDSFLVCLKNFQHRKGKISHIYSDNGTNFVGAERELRQLVQEINQRMGKDAAVEYQLEWHFNPPSGPHFGGIWERQIQTIKKGLRQMIEDWKLRKPSPEKLTATLLQIEFILNSRPLTHIPLSSEEEEVLTPFHFTIGRNGGAVSPWALTTSSIDKQHFKALKHR